MVPFATRYSSFALVDGLAEVVLLGHPLLEFTLYLRDTPPVPSGIGGVLFLLQAPAQALDGLPYRMLACNQVIA